ncbi:hypothetical protein [Burkholderia vietnamiensis]|uniref:hypothetical protein n=1 Tax=Burkholderia vietnamiensis TaxID=60552 RepID=UPI00352ECA7B
MTTDNEKGPLNQMESGQEKRSASEARALSEIVNGTPSENLCRRGSPATEQASETTAQQPRTYTTQPAESVMGIALRKCGNEMEWRHILACNPEFARMLPHEYFPVGTVLNLPPHPAAASRFEQPEKSLAPEGGSEARGRWIQANCPTGDIIKSPYPSNNREFPTSISESDCEHRIALAPSQPAAAPTQQASAADLWALIRKINGGGAGPVVPPAPSPADERAFPATDGYFVYDRAGGHVEFYDTDAERDAAHREAIAEYRRDAVHDQEWPTEVEGIVSGVVTHTTAELKVHEDSFEFEPRAVASQARAASASQPADERAAFEKWWLDGSYGFRKCDIFEPNDVTEDNALEIFREGWQAHASSANETGAKGADALAHEVWAAAQLVPGEGIEDGVQRIAAILSRSPAMAAEAVAIVDESDDGLFVEILYGANGSPLKCGDKLYAAPQPAQADARVGLTDDQRDVLTWAIGRANSQGEDACADVLRSILASQPGRPVPRAEVTDAARAGEAS